MSTPFGPQDALLGAMILTAAADGALKQSESDSIGRMIDLLPAFEGYDRRRFGDVSATVVAMLGEEDGVEQALAVVADALPPGPARETAYAFACDVAAADGTIPPEETRLLELMRHALEVDRLAAAAIERGAKARHTPLPHG